MSVPQGYAPVPPSPPSGGHRRERAPRPPFVLVAAVLAFVQAGVALLSAVGTVISVYLFEREDDGISYDDEGYPIPDGGESDGILADPGFWLAFGGSTLLMVVLLVVFGVLAMRGRLWAAIGLTVVEGLLIAGAVAQLFLNPNPAPVVFLVFPVLVIVFLWVPGSRRWLRER